MKLSLLSLATLVGAAMAYLDPIIIKVEEAPPIREEAQWY
jgi:hypothetical protein